MRRTSTNKKSFLLAVVFLVLSACVSAREVKITVQDADVGMPLEGARVRSWDGTEYTAGAAGSVTMSVPDDRQVSVTVLYPGYESLLLTIPRTGESFVASLRLNLVMQNKEMVIDGGSANGVAQDMGRSVAIGADELSRTAEVGLVEDVMSAVRLLPGVGYTGFFDAMPSIRGGEPGDLMAVLDGFYIENPYHWDGGFSIFDPRMIESARLSHGVFSARYGHTMSGLLELASKHPPAEAAKAAAEVGLSTNAADVNLSIPFIGKKGVAPKGAIIVMGKVTWWQPFIELAHLFMPISRNVKQAPWIASGALNANYRFSPALEWTLSGYFGGDGIGFKYENAVSQPAVSGTSAMSHFFDNKIGFVNTGITANPRHNMVLKAGMGAGLNQTNADILMKDKLSVSSVLLDEETSHRRTDRTIHAQGRVDFDWDLGKGFLVAAGVHERYSLWSFIRKDLYPASARAAGSENVSMDVHNNGFFTSAYTLAEYVTPAKRFGAEFGLRLDHLAITGEQHFSPKTAPVFSPRVNFDFNVAKNKKALESLDITLGTGLFAATDTALHYLEHSQLPADFTLKPSRSWTSLVGAQAEFSGGFLVSIEGYFKWVFDRAYFTDEIGTQLRFDGTGRIWGFDALLQKKQSRYWDGWISYSFTDVQYRNPQHGTNTGWHYPDFHRFHTLNLALNIKPTKKFHIAVHLGFSSGKLARVIESVGTTTTPEGVALYAPRYAAEKERTSFSLPLDIKFSWYPKKEGSKVDTEVYFGVENILGMFLPSTKTTVINPYTGAKETAGGMAVMTELAIPLPSIGVKWKW
ncbi:MAG: hypothetical protein Ta2A_24000 [Treponemataceae bacterium]|nr:MAG: hypothetical protein Ta2A_24000 [Treponemataceae bacterium]